MLFFILLIFIGYYFHKCRPDANSFREYILTNNSNSSSSSSSSQELFKFFNKLLVGQPSVPEFKLDDYYCFTVVTFRDGTATYVGFLNKWYLWSKIEVVGSKGRGKKKNSVTEMQVIEGLAYEDKEVAIRAKGKKDYHTAARSFLSAAKQFKKIGDESNLLEAANCYEDAYKAFQQVKQNDKALEALETAASIHEKNIRQSTRAARIYEILADQYKKSNSSQYSLEKALKVPADLFELDGDGRFLFSLISQAELSAEIGYYEQAIDLFDNIMTLSVNDSVLSYKTKSYIFWQCLCIIALDDWVRLEKQFKQSVEQYPSFADSRECAFINNLIQSKNSCDPSEFSTACKEYDQLTTLTPWQTHILLEAKKVLEVKDLR
ncbi:TPR-like protein [Rhizophagus irregularis]|uniref:Gamma-soluble NSF attachment protein n=1 Tax=Rhizophagus irregularis TaxID=588596 RepID=A0A2N0SFU9_9GLOM|nr:TPR-like protein [Rhizophagus irregularis]